VKDPAAIRKTLENVSTIPTLPIVIEKITRLLQNPSTSAEEIGKAITTDQALASKVLKLVNSAFYGFPGKISTITHAVVILGFATVKNVVLTASIFDAFSKRVNLSQNFDLEKFWLHSIACGAASQCIAKHIGSSAKEECFIAGLIHDVGKILMCNYLPDEFEMVMQDRIKRDCLFYESEKEVLHITHQELGGIIAERWNLPKELQNAVKNHHYQTQDKDFSTVTGIVHAADILVRALDIGNGGDNKIPQISDVVWTNLGFESIQLHTLLEDIESEVDKATVFMQLV
jgi:putative nucleotidyltransferase with HDIG domain